MTEHLDESPAEIHFVDEYSGLVQKLKGRMILLGSHNPDDFGLSPAEAADKGLIDPLAFVLHGDVVRGRMDPRWRHDRYFGRYRYDSPLEVVASEGAALARGGSEAIARAGGFEHLGSMGERLRLVSCAFTPVPSYLVWGSRFPGFSASTWRDVAWINSMSRRRPDGYELPWAWADRSEIPEHLRGNFGLRFSLDALKPAGSVVMWS